MLYLIESNGFHKIGFTLNSETLLKRMKSYQTHNPNYKLIGLSKGAVEKERELHNFYNKFRLKSNSEWFNFEDNLEDVTSRFATTSLEINILQLMDLQSKEIEECTIGEIWDDVQYITSNGVLTLVYSEKVLYIVFNDINSFGTRKLLKVDYNDIKSFYRDYDEFGELYSGFKIDNMLYFKFRSRNYKETTGMCSIEVPLFKKIEPLLRNI